MSLEEIRELCANYWNPIGIPMVNNISEKELNYRPLPADEYDSYLIIIIRMLEMGSTAAELRSYLERVEREFLMLSAPSGNKDAFISALKATSQ